MYVYKYSPVLLHVRESSLKMITTDWSDSGQSRSEYDVNIHNN